MSAAVECFELYQMAMGRLCLKTVTERALAFPPHARSLPCSFNNQAILDYTAFDRSARAFWIASLFRLSHVNMAVVVVNVSGIVIAK